MNFAHNTIRKKNTEDIILMNFAHNTIRKKNTEDIYFNEFCTQF